MLQLAALMIIAFATPQLFAQPTCLGFAPEAKLICHDGGETFKVHAFEEAACAAGRDGVLNDSVPIQNVDGPIWTDSSDLAFVTFRMNSQDVTLNNCTEI